MIHPTISPINEVALSPMMTGNCRTRSSKGSAALSEHRDSMDSDSRVVDDDDHEEFSVEEDGTWQQLGNMHPIPGQGVDDWDNWAWGRAIDLEDQQALVGAYGDSVFVPLGHAEVFVKDAAAEGGWRRRAYLSPSDGMAGDRFGWSCSMGVDIAAVGAPGAGPFTKGRVYVFRDPQAGIAETDDADAGIALSPSLAGPMDERIEVHLPCSDGAGSCTISAMNGAVLRRLSASDTARISIVGLAAGYYLLNWIPGDPRRLARARRFCIAP